MTALDQNQPARSVALSDEEFATVKPLYLLTMKPMIYAANVAEDDMADLGAANKHVQTMRNKVAKDGCELIIVSAQVSCHDLSNNSVMRSVHFVLVLCCFAMPSCSHALYVRQGLSHHATQYAQQG